MELCNDIILRVFKRVRVRHTFNCMLGLRCSDCKILINPLLFYYLSTMVEAGGSIYYHFNVP